MSRFYAQTKITQKSGTQKLCIFLTGGVYTPYSPCMSTPLVIIHLPSATQNSPFHEILFLTISWAGLHLTDSNLSLVDLAVVCILLLIILIKFPNI